MQSRHHHLELLNGVLLNMPGCVSAGRGKISQRIVTPVVREPPIEQVSVVEEIVHWFQFDRGDPEIGQMFDHRLRSQPCVCAPESLRQSRVQLCKSFHMQLIHDGFVPWRPRMSIISPGKCRIDDHPEWRICGAIPIVKREIAFRITQPVSEDFVRPSHIASDSLGIGIQ